MTGLIRHHCLAHRLNLVLKNAVSEKNELGKLKFDNFNLLQKDFNENSKFHKDSNKNMAHLKKTFTEKKLTPVKPKRILEPRWVSSAKDVAQGTYRNAHIWVEHLDGISTPGSPFSASQREKAESIENFLRDKNAIMTMIYQLDLQSFLARMSLEFQKKLSSIIGHAGLRDFADESLDTIQRMDGAFSKEFFADVKCPSQNTNNNPLLDFTESCNSLERFEEASGVEWRGMTLLANVKTHTVKENGVNVVKKYAPLSTFKTDLTNVIREMFDKYLPKDDLMEVSKVRHHISYKSYRVCTKKCKD